MAKRTTPYNESFHFREVSKMVVKLKDESDRAVALIITAWVDDALTEMLKRTLVQDEKVIDDMFRHIGPLGTFSSRIGLAYLVARISRTVYENLETIRKIRNDFAHTRDDLQFSSQSISDRCKNLYLKGFKGADGATAEFNPRNAFVATGIGLLSFFIEFVNAATISEDRREDYFPKFMNWVEDQMLDTVAKFAEPNAAADSGRDIGS
ncbi:MAG TPA: MltR family transcriptional regulator [Blastocatellia bacterium]|nr:MltR family transcriptional regulator [Blastocatellia bacterium]